MFRASTRPSSGAITTAEQPLVLPLERGGSSAVGSGRDDRPYHYHSKVTRGGAVG